MSAPTGSGKTLAAFLWPLCRLLGGELPTGAVRVLYVSPLKALNNDVRENLLEPLAELRAAFTRAGASVPEVRVLTRSGDTPPGERERMKRRPPEILVTTPESLNLILSSRGAAGMLGSLDTVILDEIHAVISNKRGTHLITAVERLSRTAGEFQRIALSATVRPLDRVCEFVGGYELLKGEQGFVYRPRPVLAVRSDDVKHFDVRVSAPSSDGAQGARRGEESAGLGAGLGAGSAVWEPIVGALREIIGRNRSTLIFTGTRRLAEKLTLMINAGAAEELAYAHHGSLSREIRSAVERRMKEGKLRAIVATSSLELGIDIGSLDEVVLVGSPPSVSSAIQRIGRAGHRVGVPSRGAIFPYHPRDFLDAALLVRCIREKEIEEARIVASPLDVLAQVIVSMCGIEAWNVDDLYAFVRRCCPYHDLPRRQFDLVIEMLAGRYSESRIRELRPRVNYDRIANVVRGREGSLTLLYHSGGTIPDRGYYRMRRQGSPVPEGGSGRPGDPYTIGELDEEFVWERRVGDAFSLGTQSWRITRIDHQSVEVAPFEGKAKLIPFWRAERESRGFHLSERIGEFLESWGDRLEGEELRVHLRESCRMDARAAAELLDLLARQRAAFGGVLPHRRRIVIEHVRDPLNESGTKQVVLHTLWGGMVNKPFAHALSSAWGEKYDLPLEVCADDDAVLLLLPHEFDASDLTRLVNSRSLETLLRKGLENTGLFGARFRENAARALLLPKGGFGKRMPLWLNRLRSKKLLEAVMGYGDFPILLETWRECLNDEFDLDALRRLLDELESGEIGVSEVRTFSPSPFARGLVWRQTNTHIYQGDELASGKSSRVSEDLLREVALSPSLRPEIGKEDAEQLRAKLQRTAPGYAPGTPFDLLGWVVERLLIPIGEWEELLAAIERDHGVPRGLLLGPLNGKLVEIGLPGAGLAAVAAAEALPRLTKATRLAAVTGARDRPLQGAGLSEAGGARPDGDAPVEERETAFGEVLGEWLAYYGPVELETLRALFGAEAREIEDAVQALAESESVVVGRITEGGPDREVCDARNLEYLLRTKRTKRRAGFSALDPDSLPLFLATWQGLAARGRSPESLKRALEKLFGYPLPVELWEEEVFPARLDGYSTSWLDTLLRGSDLIWFGCGRSKAGFCFRDELPLFSEARALEDEGRAAFLPAMSVRPGAQNKSDSAGTLLPHPGGKYGFREILETAGLPPDELNKILWDRAWKGDLFNDGWEGVRRGIQSGFRMGEPEGPRAARGRGAGWSSTIQAGGSWFRQEREGQGLDPIGQEERVKDRVRQLLERYGVLFRQLLERELPALRWQNVFRTLRVMELGGEAVGGQFFARIPGIQFASPRAHGMLLNGISGASTYWMNACDPASLCGAGIEGLRGRLPARLPPPTLSTMARSSSSFRSAGGRSSSFSSDPKTPGSAAA